MESNPGADGGPSEFQRCLPVGPRSLRQVHVQSRLIAPHERAHRAVHHAQYQTAATRRLWGKTRPLSHSAIRFSLHHSLKIDISAFHIRADQLHAEPSADVHAFKTALQSSFNGRMQKADPRAFLRRAGDDGVELLPNP